MTPVAIRTSNGRPPMILCLGAHCDDIEIGCGASLITLIQSYPGAQVHWEVFCSTNQRKHESEAGARAICAEAAHLDININEYRDGFLPYLGDEVKCRFEELKGQVEPDLIFTHYGNDKHQDHRVVSELTWNTFRNNVILEYEIPKWDGDLGQPNTYIPISESIAKRKIEIILQVYQSQRQKLWFTDDVFRAILRLRGMEITSESGLAEAFYARKLCIV